MFTIGKPWSVILSEKLPKTHMLFWEAQKIASLWADVISTFSEQGVDDKNQREKEKQPFSQYFFRSPRNLTY